MYSFLFDRRSMALLLVGVTVAGMLLFAGGVFVGLQLRLESSGPVTVAEFRPLSPPEPAAATSQPPAAPAAEPATRAAAAPAAAAGAAVTPPAAPAPLTLPEALPAIAEPELPPAAVDPPRPSDGLEVQQIALAAEPLPEPPGSPDPLAESAGRPAVIGPAATPPVAVPASLPPPAAVAAAPSARPAMTAAEEAVPILTHGELSGPDGQPTFGVQVAAFELRSTAARIAAELIRRGWESYLVPFETRSGRQMYSVRFGRFANGRDAYRAARDFEERERAPALVRLQLQED